MSVTFNEEPNTVVSNGQYGVILTTIVFGEERTQESIAYSALTASEWRMDDETLIFVNCDKETEVMNSEFSDSKMVLSLTLKKYFQMKTAVFNLLRQQL